MRVPVQAVAGESERQAAGRSIEMQQLRKELEALRVREFVTLQVQQAL
jgi:hypothetical protein